METQAEPVIAEPVLCPMGMGRADGVTCKGERCAAFQRLKHRHHRQGHVAPVGICGMMPSYDPQSIQPRYISLTGGMVDGLGNPLKPKQD